MNNTNYGIDCCDHPHHDSDYITTRVEDDMVYLFSTCLMCDREFKLAYSHEYTEGVSS